MFNILNRKGPENTCYINALLQGGLNGPLGVTENEFVCFESAGPHSIHDSGSPARGLGVGGEGVV